MSRIRLGFWYRLVVVVLRPPLMVLTRRDWQGGSRLEVPGGVIVAANHISHVDPLTLAHFLHDNGRPPRFMAKESLFRAPVIGRVITGCRQIPVFRESRDATKALRAATAALDQGECVVIYPEGTITRDPGLWPMVGKTGVARMALRTGHPVIPVAQWGAQAILPRNAKRPRFFPRRTIHVLAGPPVDLEDLRDRPITSEVLRQATERIMAAITEGLEQIRGDQAPDVPLDPRRPASPGPDVQEARP